MIRTIFAAILIFASFGASAQVYTAVSNEGELMDEFISRIAPQAVAYTLKNQVEVCGMIGESSGKYSIIVRASKKNAECEMSRKDMVDGFKDSGQSFHTHPSIMANKFKGIDYLVPGYLATFRGVRHQSGIGTDRTVFRFSDRQQKDMLPNN